MPSLQDAIAAIQLERDQLVARLGQLDAALAALTSVQVSDPTPPAPTADTPAGPGQGGQDLVGEGAALVDELAHRRMLAARAGDTNPSTHEGTGLRPYYHRRREGADGWDSTQLVFQWVCNHQAENLTAEAGHKALGMSRATISHALVYLEEQGIVAKVGKGDAKGRLGKGRHHVYRSVEVTDAQAPAGDGGPPAT